MILDAWLGGVLHRRIGQGGRSECSDTLGVARANTISSMHHRLRAERRVQGHLNSAPAPQGEGRADQVGALGHQGCHPLAPGHPEDAQDAGAAGDVCPQGGR